ncbi:phytoene desaturase [Candidatus Dojkabacteria bacterium]|nr:phytoene desaturase [Candidatus Dojkabacteria bacterium]
MKKVVIIGAGLAGLATSALLGKKGYSVTVIEKNEQPGGRARKELDNSFLYDIGPSWYMMPEVFDRYFELFGKKTSDFYKLIRLDPSYRIFFSDSEFYDIRARVEDNKDVFNKLEKDGYNKFLKYLEKSKFIYESSLEHLVYKDYDDLGDILDPKILAIVPKLSLLSTVHKEVSRYVEDPRLQKLLEFTTVFLGASPYEASGLYSLISHADFNLGIWYPDGGIWKVADALYRLAQDNNVEFRFNEPVTAISVSNGSAVSVKTDQDSYDADIVVSGADYPHTELDLLPEVYRTYGKKYWEKRKLSPSCFNIFLGVGKKIEKLRHHNLYLDPNWDQHFADVRDNPRWPDNPSYYVCATSKTDKTVAPDGCENLFFLVPVAPGLDDTDEVRDHMYQRTIAHFEELVGQKVSDSIRSKMIFAQREFRSYYNSYKGTAFGLAHTLLQTAIFRPRVKSKKVKNLYYTGQFTQPGVGMPIALISAEIVANKILKEQK